MSREPFMPLAVSDFLGSSACAEMTGEQQAIYLLLLAHAWNQKEKGLPSRLDAIAKLTHLDLRKSRRDIVRVLTHFQQVSGRYYHTRVNRDIERVRARSEARRLAAEKRWSKNKKGEDTKQMQSECIAKAMHPSGYGYGYSSSSSSLEGGMQGGISAEPSNLESKGRFPVEPRNGPKNAQNGTFLSSEGHNLTQDPKRTADASYGPLRASTASKGISGSHQKEINAFALPMHPDSVDVESEARRLFDRWREAVNSADPQSSAMPVLRARLTDGWSPKQLELAIERKAIEVHAEAAKGVRYKLKNFFRDPRGEWTELLSDSWTEPVSRSDSTRTHQDPEVYRKFMERHSHD
jgi:uncharacterized protein YdaU (DUF1376 family)